MKKSSFGTMTDEERAALAGRIRIIVDAAGSQGSAAKLAQVSIRQIAAYTRAESAPPLLPIARLATALGYDMNWVMSGRGAMKRGPVQGPADLLATQMPTSELEAEGSVARTMVAKRVALALGVAYAELDTEPSQNEIQNAALTIATLVLDVPRMRADEMPSAAAEFAVVAHRQAHRMISASGAATASAAKRRS